VLQEDEKKVKKIWTDRITNEEDLEKLSERKSMWKSIQKRKNALIGHILSNSSLLLLIFERVIDGKNHRGRPRLR
jgi:hypothetical protein